MPDAALETQMRPELQIKPPIQEKAEPTKNFVENFDKLFYLMREVTRAGHYRGIKRPLFSRTKRAKLYKEFRRIPKDNIGSRKNIIQEARVRDAITGQYLNQGEISIDLLGLGEQKSHYIDVLPPEPLKTKETESKAPIVLIPGISNDIECVGGIVHEVAMLGRRIIVIGYPESFQGTTTKKFAEAVEKDDGYGPHVEFYKYAINQLTGENEKNELWGYSTGAPIVESILNDPEFQQKTENAVLLCPASSVDQSMMSINLGIVHDIGFIRQLNLLPRLSWTFESVAERSKEQKQLRKAVFKSLLKKVSRAYDYWKSAKVAEGGRIVIVSGRKDHVTKSAKMNDQFLRNPQVKIVDLMHGYHATPGVDAEYVIPLILQAQKLEGLNQEVVGI